MEFSNSSEEAFESDCKNEDDDDVEVEYSVNSGGEFSISGAFSFWKLC